MKRHRYLFFLPLFWAAACSQEPLPPHSSELSIQVLSDFSVESKVTADTELTAADKKINSVQLVIFDRNQNIEARLSSEQFRIADNKATAQVELSAGTKEVWCVVNGPDISGKNRAEIEAMTVDLAGYNSSSQLIQFAQATVSLTAGQSSNLPLKSRRLVSRLSVRKIENALENQQSITEMYLFVANYVKNSYLSRFTGVSDQYGNRSGLNAGTAIRGDHPAEDAALTACALTSPLAWGKTDNGIHRMYSYPTPTGGENPWMVLAAQIGGNWYYYNTRLPAIESNKAYTLALTLRHLGAETPCTDNDLGSLSVSVTAEDWSTGSSTEKTF